MKGSIKAAKGAVCVKCGKSTFKSEYSDDLGYNVPRCTACRGRPSKLRVTKIIPGPDGKGQEITLYKDSEGNLLTTYAKAFAVIGVINEDMRDGSYRPDKYRPQDRAKLQFSNFAKAYLETALARTRLPEEHDDFLSPGGYSAKKKYIEKHLIPFFKETQIEDIKKAVILSYYRSWNEKFRTRDLALGELRAILRYAKNEMEVLKEVPPFPKLKKAKGKRADEIPSLEVQAKIIEGITNPKYKAMYVLAAVLAKRPCEVRAYKVGDVSLSGMTITTQRHFSRDFNGWDVPLKGRKSQKETEEKGVIVDPLDDFLVSLLAPYVIGRDASEWLFKGHIHDAVGQTTLYDAWMNSARALGLKARPYEGTKHATLSDLLKTTGDYARVLELSQHTNVASLQRYAKIKAEEKRGLVDTKRFGGVN